MANPDRPNGFSPQNGVIACRRFYVDASNGTAFKKGDVVMKEADGRVAPATAGDTNILGSTDDRLAASTAGTVHVYCDVNQLFSAQDNGGGTVSIDNTGLNCDHEANAGNTTLFLSGHELDFSGIAATSTLGFTVLEAIEGVEYSVDSAGEPDTDNQQWLVRVNEHAFGTAISGV